VIRKARLASGLILLVFVTMHLMNAMAGQISLAAMDAARIVFYTPWTNPVGLAVLYGALLVHFTLALVALYQRRSLRMPAGEAVQLIVGLAIPPLLAIHVSGTRGAFQAFDALPSYTSVMLIYWVLEPKYAVQQVLVLLTAWLHGCLGIFYWLRLKPVWARLRLPAFAGAILVPLLALLGFLQGGKEVLQRAADPAWIDAVLSEARTPTADQIKQLVFVADVIVVFVLVSIAVALCLRFVRSVWEKRHGIVRLAYDNGKVATFPAGLTILEASRANGVPHAEVCGGRGRCSTCRIRIHKGLDLLPAVDTDEQRVLDRVNAAEDVRLACQTVPPHGEYEIARLLSTSASAREGHSKPGYLRGQEMEIAILFADIRGFTKLSEEKLPYDVVFLLNRYFDSMGHAIEESGGHLDKFIGDGVMALFGIGRDAATGCRQAVDAARGMSERLKELNNGLSHDLPEPLRIGIGIHAGPAIVGEMGYAQATQITAVGDTVNTASRLEGMTKELGVQLVLSDSVARLAGIDTDGLDSREITVRGRAEPMTILSAGDASAVGAQA